MDLRHDEYEYSGFRTALYYELMERDRLFERDVAMLISRSAVVPSQESDFKTNIKTVTELRDSLDDRLPYRQAALDGKTPAQASREAMAARYMDYAEKVFGKERIQEFLKNGKL